MTITHDGGDRLQRAQLRFDDTDGNRVDPVPFPNEVVTAGDRATVGVDSDDTVMLIWTAESGDDHAIIGRWQGPDS